MRKRSKEKMSSKSNIERKKRVSGLAVEFPERKGIM